VKWEEKNRRYRGQDPFSHPLSWRKHIGVVMQDDQLLSGSISDYISFFDPQVNMERIYQVAMMA